MLRFNKRVLFYIMTAILILLIFLRYSFQIDVPRIVLTCLIVAIAFISDSDEILAIMMGCIPLHNAIDFYLALSVCAVIYIVKHLDRFQFSLVPFCVFILVLYELLHGINSDFLISSFVVDISMLIVLTAVVGVKNKDVNYSFVVRVMAFCTLAMGLMLIMHSIEQAGGNVIAAFDNLYRLGNLKEDEITYGGAINPNTLGVINVLAVTGLIQLSIQGERKRIDSFLIIALLIIGTLTISRTFVVCVLLMAIMLIIGQPGTIGEKTKSILAMVSILTVTIILIQVLLPELFGSFARRNQTDGLTSGRDMLMIEYHRFIIENPRVMWFGFGVNNFIEKVLYIYGVASNGPHLSIQEIIIAWGIIGLIMFGILLLMMIVESNRYNKRRNIINYIPFVIILVKSLAGQLLTSGYSMLALSFAYLSLCQEFSQVKVMQNDDYTSVRKHRNIIKFSIKKG